MRGTRNAPKQFQKNPNKGRTWGQPMAPIPSVVPHSHYSTPAEEAMQKKLSSGQKPSASAAALEKKLNNK